MQLYFTKGMLIDANEEAIAADRSRTLVPEKLQQLSNKNAYPVAKAFTHNGVEVRCSIVVDATGRMAYLDVPFDTFFALPHDPHATEEGYHTVLMYTLAEDLLYFGPYTDSENDITNRPLSRNPAAGKRPRRVEPGRSRRRLPSATANEQ